MQVWDILALYFCCGDPYEEHVDPVPTSYSEKGGVTLTIKPVGQRKVSFDPYPFDARPLSVQLFSKRLPKASYENAGEFHRAYFGAESELCRFDLV
jgi:hypothetical protein